jgi:restriction system protein
MKQYYRILLGKSSIYAADCFAGGFIGVDFDCAQDLTQHLPDNWKDFNKEFIPVYQAKNPGKSKVTAGLLCGMTHTVAKGLQLGDVVICPNGVGGFRVGEVTGPYQYKAGEILPHRRSVQWFAQIIQKDEMTSELLTSCTYGAISNLSAYTVEIEKLIGDAKGPVLTISDPDVQDPYAFAMEKHLEEFIVQNWSHTTFGNTYKIFADSDGNSGQQFDIGDGRIDILAISKDQKTLLVIELKRGRTSDVVVGQILRYMGYVKEVLAESSQDVKGAIIALEDDSKLRMALKIVPQIEFFRYQIDFKLVKAQ